MKKIVINLPKGIKFKINETEDTLEVVILREKPQTIKSKLIKKVVSHVVSRDASTGKFAEINKPAKRTTAKAHKRSGTGGTGPRKKK